MKALAEAALLRLRAEDARGRVPDAAMTQRLLANALEVMAERLAEGELLMFKGLLTIRPHLVVKECHDFKTRKRQRVSTVAFDVNVARAVRDAAKANVARGRFSTLH